MTQNVVSKIDGATGKVTVNPETTFTEAGQTRFVCPTANGGKDFQAGAYSPLTNAMYYGLQNTCMDMTAINNPNYGVLVQLAREDHAGHG